MKSYGCGGNTPESLTKYFILHLQKMGSLPNLLPTHPIATLKVKVLKKKGACNERH